ncbi:MAG: hypothetical protein BWY64_02754 [bacterium ADurb.Bin363]|nr:MAG: hypothetical protein BWY64_02754 [bacterium ADurb.Bin363]
MQELYRKLLSNLYNSAIILFMNIIFKYFWIFIIIVNIINANSLKNKSRSYITLNPELEDGYNKIIKGFLIYANIPWIIMGTGILSGFTYTIFDYLTPDELNPFVFLFYTSIIIIWLYGFYWIYVRGGAEYLAKHPGLIRKRKKVITSPALIKFYTAITVLGGITIIIILFTGGINLKFLR